MSGGASDRDATAHSSSVRQRGRGWFARGSIGRLVVLFMLAGLGAFVLCGVGLTLAQRHAALREAVRDAEVTTALLASRVVQPALPPTLVRVDTDRGFDRVVRERVLVAPITQVLIADEAGSVLYATEAGLVGQRVELSAEELYALRTGLAVARGEDGTDPIRLGSGRAGQFLDVSVGLQTSSGQPLLLQTRQPYEVVWLTSRAVWLTTLPSLVVALALLYLVKSGFAFRLARDLHVVQEGREQLFVTALAAADRERTLIASDLHDGVVQGLAGASFTLSDAANRTRQAGQPEVAHTLAETAGSLRRWVRELRSLIVTVTPPALHTEGLRAALTDLVAALEARGIDVELDVRVSDELTETAESLVYRVAQEAVRNVVRHAHASKVQLIVAEEDGWIQLQVSDDGQGFDPSMSARRQGSVGLNLLAALVQQRGGNLRVESAAGRGTSVTLRLPVHSARSTDTATTEAVR
jgi:two-component system, NarL family, sensor kinase